MPVATLSPYAGSYVFSQTPSEEIRQILASIRKEVRAQLTPQDLWRLKQVGITSVLYDKDLSVFVSGNATTISRWTNGKAAPSKDTLNFLRELHSKVREAPNLGAESLMDYVRREENRQGTTHDPDPPSPYDSWDEFGEQIGDWDLSLSYQVQILLHLWERSNEPTIRLTGVERSKITTIRRQVGSNTEGNPRVFQRVMTPADGGSGSYEIILTTDPALIKELGGGPRESTLSEDQVVEA